MHHHEPEANNIFLLFSTKACPKGPLLGSTCVILVYISAYLRVLLTASLIKGCGCYFKKLLQSGIFPSVWISEGDCILRGLLLLCNKPPQNSIVVYNNSHLFCSRIYKLGRSRQRLGKTGAELGWSLLHMVSAGVLVSGWVVAGRGWAGAGCPLSRWCTYTAAWRPLHRLVKLPWDMMAEF